MPRPARSADVVRFDRYEADLRAEELYKAGRKIRLQVQPFHVLAILLEQPGEVVTRKELRERLWPADTFVDFEHSLNTAIKKLRQALGDDKKKPHFIETLPKRGYRFLVDVKRPAALNEHRRGRENESTANAAASPLVGHVARIVCEDGHSFAVVAVDEAAAMERNKLEAASDDVGLSLLIASQRLLMVPRGMPVRIIEVKQSLSHCEARILEGEHYGKTALLPLKLLAETSVIDAEAGPRQWNLVE